MDPTVTIPPVTKNDTLRSSSKYLVPSIVMFILGLAGGISITAATFRTHTGQSAPVTIAETTLLPSILPSASPTPCTWDSGWYGFSFAFTPGPDGCSGPYDELTDYAWPTLPNGMTIYPRHNLTGIAWWKAMITDEAGFLPDSKYTFTTGRWQNGIETLTVSIDGNAVHEQTDGVAAGIDKGSSYYFGKNWVIRDKFSSSGGPCPECDLFLATLKPIPITMTRRY